MGFLDNVKKTIVDNLPDVVTNPQISGQSNEMIYKYDKIAIIKGSRLIAKQLLTLAYGGSSPNRAEIWFVNKAVVC